jgi:cytoskeletal protein RodZ
MRKVLFLALAIALSVLNWQAFAGQAKKKSPAKKTGGAAVANRTTAATAKKSAPTAASKSRTTASRKSTTSASARRNTRTAPAKSVTWRNRQTSPSADRFREIQDALAAKGYLRPEQAAGNWDAASADALKRFQADQNIEASGKINSLSLIALGLGPRHEISATKPLTETPGVDR